MPGHARASRKPLHRSPWMSLNLLRRPSLFLCLILLLIAPVLVSAQEDNSLGVVVPRRTTEPTLIAVPSFGVDDNSPLEFDTLPRIVRRDLELSGFFKIHPNQREVSRLNLLDVQKRTVDIPAWQALGVQHYLMADISRPQAGTLRARVLLYDIPSGKMVMSRYIDGPETNVRLLAHRIADEVVRFLKFTDGIAQTQLIYIAEQIPGIKEVYIMDADGFNQRPLTRYNNICTTPVWGANGTEFYYTSYHGNRANIYGQQLSSGQTWTIAAYGGTNHSPSWNASRQQVLMVLSKDGGSELYTAGRDGQDARRLTRTKANEASPCWSPDGSKIAFASNEAGGVQIFVANADGSNRKRLTTRGSWNDAPSWSPDGTRIAFVARIDNTHDIFTIAADGNPSSVRRLTQGQGNNESPSWAPNSRHLTFSSDRSGQWQVYIMLDDGSNQIALTSQGRNTQPAWGPLPAAQ
ncbi:MAG: TolB protein [Candidatus Sumerlaeota bacterium]|nr:TolB protein [Candidatus Sumerlaeota bacterium]